MDPDDGGADARVDDDGLPRLLIDRHGAVREQTTRLDEHLRRARRPVVGVDDADAPPARLTT